MKKKYIALIMIVMAACFGTLALPSPAAKPTPKPASDTTVSVEYLQQIEQQNQRMADSVALLRMEQQLAEYVEKKAEENRNYSLGIFGACMTLITCAIGFLGIFLPWKSNDKLRKELDETTKGQIEFARMLGETASKSQQAVAEISRLKATIQEYSKQAKESVQKAQKSANEAKALTYFAEALKVEDLDRQIDLYTKSLKFGPNYAKAYNNRGIAYKDKGEYDKAIKDCTRAIGINPNLAEAYNTRGEANKGLAEKMEAKGKTEEALELFKAAVMDFDKFLELYTKDDEKRKSAIRRKQKCEEAIERLGGGKK